MTTDLQISVDKRVVRSCHCEVKGRHLGAGNFLSAGVKVHASFSYAAAKTSHS